VVSAAWHFDGAIEDVNKRNGWSYDKLGSFPVKGTFAPVDKAGAHVRLKTNYTLTRQERMFQH